MDHLSRLQRRKNMQAIRSSDTGIERTMREALSARGLRYRLNVKYLPGKPDIVFVRDKVAVFCDSEFWHGKNWGKVNNRIKTNSKFWKDKIEGNIARDRRNVRALRKAGWRVIRFWGKEITKNTDKCVKVVVANLPSRTPGRAKALKHSAKSRIARRPE